MYINEIIYHRGINTTAHVYREKIDGRQGHRVHIGHQIKNYYKLEQVLI